MLILRFNVDRYDYIVDIDDMRKPEFVYVFWVFIDMQDYFIAVAGLDELFISDPAVIVPQFQRTFSFLETFLNLLSLSVNTRSFIAQLCHYPYFLLGVYL